MSNEFATEAANLIADIKDGFATTVTYTRPSNSKTASLSAGVGSTPTEQPDNNGIFEKVEYRDWIVAAADLTFTDGTSFLPARKDTIATTTSTYEVIGIGPDGPPYEYSDRHETIVRIHSQKVA